MTEYTLEEVARAYQEWQATYDKWWAMVEAEGVEVAGQMRGKVGVKLARWEEAKRHLLSLDVGVEDAG